MMKFKICSKSEAETPIRKQQGLLSLKIWRKMIWFYWCINKNAGLSQSNFHLGMKVISRMKYRCRWMANRLWNIKLISCSCKKRWSKIYACLLVNMNFIGLVRFWAEVLLVRLIWLYIKFAKSWWLSSLLMLHF